MDKQQLLELFKNSESLEQTDRLELLVQKQIMLAGGEYRQLTEDAINFAFATGGTTESIASNLKLVEDRLAKMGIRFDYESFMSIIDKCVEASRAFVHDLKDSKRTHLEAMYPDAIPFSEMQINANDPEVLGAVAFYKITGLVPKGKVELIATNFIQVYAADDDDFALFGRHTAEGPSRTGEVEEVHPDHSGGKASFIGFMPLIWMKERSKSIVRHEFAHIIFRLLTYKLKLPLRKILESYPEQNSEVIEIGRDKAGTYYEFLALKHKINDVYLNRLRFTHANLQSEMSLEFRHDLGRMRALGLDFAWDELLADFNHRGGLYYAKALIDSVELPDDVKEEGKKHLYNYFEGLQIGSTKNWLKGRKYAEVQSELSLYKETLRRGAGEMQNYILFTKSDITLHPIKDMLEGIITSLGVSDWDVIIHWLFLSYENNVSWQNISGHLKKIRELEGKVPPEEVYNSKQSIEQGLRLDLENPDMTINEALKALEQRLNLLSADLDLRVA